MIDKSIITNENRCHYKKIHEGYDEKLSYNTFFEAKLVCNNVNRVIATEFKIIPYKCKICNKIHIGKSLQVLNDYNIKIINKIKNFNGTFTDI